MPNWCSNSVVFRSKDTQAISRLAEEFSKEKGEPFAYLRQQPEEFPEVEKSYITFVGDNGERGQIESSLPNWYQWRLANWGTKWDAAYADVLSQSDTEILVQFDTAWSPPIALYDYLTEQGWEIEAEYREEGLCFEGKYTNGIDNCWDIEPEEDEEETFIEEIAQ